MRTVYFDSTILSYLYDERPQIEFLIRATKEWWQTEKPHFDCFLSNETLRELGEGGDALHLALASHHKIDYLLSWNYSHLVNENKRRHIRVLNDN